jgi:hypothetical protein
VCAALPVLRRKDSSGSDEVPLPLFRAPIGNALAVASVFISITLATRMNLREAITMALTFSLATLYWYLNRHRRNEKSA